MKTFVEGCLNWDAGGVLDAVGALDLSQIDGIIRDSKGPELAEQLKDVIDKTRTIIDRKDIREASRGDVDPGPANPRARQFMREFAMHVSNSGAGPTLLIRYEREAWVSEVDHYARVTFDRHIRSQVMQRLSLSTDPRGWRANDNEELAHAVGPVTVLELKFTSAVPRWMMNVVMSFDLMRRAFSKYGTSLKTWFMTPTLRTPVYGRG